MARYLIAVWPSDGHVNPTIPLARMLVERGHEVLWYCSTPFKEKIQRTGAGFAPFKNLKNFTGSTLDEHFPEYMKMKGLKQFKWGVRNIIGGTMEGFDLDVNQLLQQFQPDVLVTCPTYTGIIPLRLRGNRIKVVCIGMLPLSVTSPDIAPFGLGIKPLNSPIGRMRNRMLNFLVQKVIFRSEQQHFNNLLRGIGLPKLNYWVFDAAVFYSDVYLQGTCPSFEYPNSCLPDNVQFVGPYNLTTSAADFQLPSWWEELQTAKRVVLVTQGTLANDNFNHLMIPAIQALADKDVFVVATTGNKELTNLPFKLPNNVRVEKYIPYSLLMPHLDAMITNAGYGGVHYAIQHGVPLIVWGKSEDKSEVSARVDWSGIGISLRSSRVKASDVGAAVDKIFSSPSYKVKVAQMQQEIASYDAYQLSVQCLEKTASTNDSDTEQNEEQQAFVTA